MGKTPEALKMQAQRENARDTWDRFMGEKATQELFEGMLNLLTVKMEKPSTSPCSRMISRRSASLRKQLTRMAKRLRLKRSRASKCLTVPRPASSHSASPISKSAVGYQYLIDANSTMKQDEEEQFQALMATWKLTHQTPGLIQGLAAKGVEYDEHDHLKKIFIAAGISDWDKILKENPALLQQMQQSKAANGGAPQPQGPGMDPAALAASASRRSSYLQGMPAEMQGGGMPQGAPQGQPQQPMQPMMPQQPMQQQPMQGPPMGPQMQPGPQFEDPQIAQLAQQMMAGVSR
jgi:hypothetical protein